QFHWDLEGKRDEHASCWIRTSQAWAGTGWGFQFIPRIGMEVLVSFVGGDLDRPMVTGRVYNGVPPPSHPLPKSKSRSGIRTQSTLGGGGYNEIAFEDLKGAEQFYVHAQKDLDEVVENDHTLGVRANERIDVRGTRSDTVGGDEAHVVGGHRSET